MARTFDGAAAAGDDQLEVLTGGFSTIGGAGGAWTLGAWIYPTNNGEGGFGHIVYIGNEGTVARLRLHTTYAVEVVHDHSTDMIYRSTTNRIVTNSWQCVIGERHGSTYVGRIWTGDLDSPMTEVTYATSTPGSGAANDSGTYAAIGNNDGQSNTFGGRIAHAFCLGGLTTDGERQAFQQGDMSWLLMRDDLRFYVPLNDKNTSANYSMYHIGARCDFLNVGGATDGEDPPIWTPGGSVMNVQKIAAAPPAATSLIFNRGAMTRAQLVR